MKWSELKGTSVVSVNGAEKLGAISDMYLDSTGRRILGLQVKAPGLLGRRDAVMWAELKAVGGDATTVQDASRLNKPDSFTDLQGSVTVSSITGSRVMTENGVEIGKISDVQLSPEEGVVSTYLLGESIMGRIRGDEHPVAITDVKSLGSNLVVVSNSVSAP
ncbi:MAG: hypothetical protein NVSMB52_01650 [Chloroflexota bacterium]